MPKKGRKGATSCSIVFGSRKKKKSLSKGPIIQRPNSTDLIVSIRLTRAQQYQNLIRELNQSPNLEEIFELKDNLPFKNQEWVNRLQPGAQSKKKIVILKKHFEREPDPEVEGSYRSIEAPKSKKPKRKYCDLTGLRAKYTDRRTGLHYYSVEQYKEIFTMKDNTKDQHLALRNAVVKIKK